MHDSQGRVSEFRFILGFIQALPASIRHFFEIMFLKFKMKLDWDTGVPVRVKGLS